MIHTPALCLLRKKKLKSSSNGPCPESDEICSHSKILPLFRTNLFFRWFYFFLSFPFCLPLSLLYFIFHPFSFRLFLSFVHYHLPALRVLRFPSTLDDPLLQWQPDVCTFPIMHCGSWQLEGDWIVFLFLNLVLSPLFLSCSDDQSHCRQYLFCSVWLLEEWEGWTGYILCKFRPI